jgi:hypothetical protein
MRFSNPRRTFDTILEVDSFKRSSKIKNHSLFEVDFLLFYAQNEQNLSESDIAKMVRGVGLEPTKAFARGS